MSPRIFFDEKAFAPRLLPTLLTLFMLAVLIGLGTWQLYRAEWKGRLIAEWQTQSAKLALEELPPPDQSGTVTYRRARLLGKFQHEKSLMLSPRVKNDREGVELITPLKLLTGETVLVDRGFVAKESTASIDQPIGAVFVEGELRAFYPRGWMQPENKPGAEQWYWLDPAAAASAKNLGAVYPLELIAELFPLSAWMSCAPCKRFPTLNLPCA
ncbi:MAG: SURF1 family protein [Proteobacteria bacterium]|nr:SURF1 family protein [Pseudomonadota bacterium]